MANLIETLVGIIRAPLRMRFEKPWTQERFIVTDATIVDRFRDACMHTNYTPTHI